MGALKVGLDIVDSYGTTLTTIQELYIFRTAKLEDISGVYEYYVTLVPNASLEWVNERAFTDNVEQASLATPHAKFLHKYDDGAELCAARAIIALKDAGMI